MPLMAMMVMVMMAMAMISTWCKLEPRDPWVLPRALFRVLLGPADWNSRICLEMIIVISVTIVTITLIRTLLGSAIPFPYLEYSLSSKIFFSPPPALQ